MKKIGKIILAFIFSLLFLVVAVGALQYYTVPMEDRVYSLSMMLEDGQDLDAYDQKGWIVYTNEQGKVTELTPDGTGGFSGLSMPGQTIYYSRTMSEVLDAPTLRIGAVNRTVSVFLDNTLIYTDCPDLDSRIGYFTLPVLEYDRAEELTVSLPLDYRNHTLTIAQATPEISETQTNNGTVWPCAVTLYCGYSYESGLISETARIMIPSVLLCVLGILLAVLFIWTAIQSRTDWGLPFLFLAALFQMGSVLSRASFLSKYMGEIILDLPRLSLVFSCAALLSFFTVHAKRFRRSLIALSALQWLSCIASVLAQKEAIPYGSFSPFLMNLPQFVGFSGLILALPLICLQRPNKENRLFAYIARALPIFFLSFVLFMLAYALVTPQYLLALVMTLKNELLNLYPFNTLRLLWTWCMLSGAAALLADLFFKESRRRTEMSILREKNKLIQESYENLERSTEEIMMLRHDVNKHYSLLYNMAVQSPERVPSYLKELIGQTNDARSVISCENKVLNMVLNAKLNIAAARDIPVEIIRASAPKDLPLSEPELGSLIMNIMDNALRSAGDCLSKDRFLRLDFHCKDGHFLFSCENSRPPAQQYAPSAGHGYGLKIMRHIMRKWNEMIFFQEDDTSFKVSFALPLNHSSK